MRGLEEGRTSRAARVRTRTRLGKAAGVWKSRRTERRLRRGMRLAPSRTAKGRQLVEGPVPIGGDTVGLLGCPPPSEILCLM